MLWKSTFYAWEASEKKRKILCRRISDRKKNSVLFFFAFWNIIELLFCSCGAWKFLGSVTHRAYTRIKNEKNLGGSKYLWCGRLPALRHQNAANGCSFQFWVDETYPRRKAPRRWYQIESIYGNQKRKADDDRLISMPGNRVRPGIKIEIIKSKSSGEKLNLASLFNLTIKEVRMRETSARYSIINKSQMEILSITGTCGGGVSLVIINKSDKIIE